MGAWLALPVYIIAYTVLMLAKVQAAIPGSIRV